MKGRFLVVLWFAVGLMWLIFGLLNWFRLHLRFFGAAYFAMAALAFLIAVRCQRQRSQRQGSLTRRP